jgi:hypothetical protein
MSILADSNISYASPKAQTAKDREQAQFINDLSDNFTGGKGQ